MPVNQAQQGQALYYKDGSSNVINNINKMATRQPAATDDAAKFFHRGVVTSCMLYLDLASAVTVPSPYDGSLSLYVAGCKEVTLQVIGTSPGTLVIEGSLDGATWATANQVASADNFIRIQSAYKWIRVSTPNWTSGTYSIYLMIS